MSRVWSPRSGWQAMGSAGRMLPSMTAPARRSRCLNASSIVAALAIIVVIYSLATQRPGSDVRRAGGHALLPTASASTSKGGKQPDKYERLMAQVLRQDSRAAADCSAEYKAEMLANVTAGHRSPPVLDWTECELEQCGGEFVSKVVESYRARQSSLLGMVPCDLYREIVGRTLWILGDSQMQRFYSTLNCFMAPLLERAEQPRRRWDFVIDPAEFAAIKERVLDAPRSRQTGCGEYCGHTAGVGDLWCTVLVGDTRVCHIRVNRAQHLVLDFLPNLHMFNVTRDDILVTNFGLWHHRRDGDFAQLTQQLADYYVQHRAELPEAFIWRDSTPQHFDIENGEFPHPDEAGNKLSWPFKCVPIQGVELLPDGRLVGNNTHVVQGGWRNIESEPIIRATGMLYMQTWNETVPMWDGHTSSPHSECSHWCFPGAYNVYAWQLWELLKGRRSGSSGQQQQPASAKVR